jgi:hypothetical protein
MTARSANWLDTDEHRDQAFALHQLIAAKDGPYVAAAWLIGHTPRIGTDHGADARTTTLNNVTD